MHLGIDFDNTIVSYDRLFHRHAVMRGHLPPDAPSMGKREIRDRIRLLPEGETRWIELQGLVYGKHIDEAEPAPGLDRFLTACASQAVRVFIISHKTRYPALGEQYDLRQAAAGWITKQGLAAQFGLSPADCFFVDTVEEKLALIGTTGCTLFIDDLAEVLQHPAFPPGVGKILYSAPPMPDLPPDIRQFDTWEEIRTHVFGGG